MTRKITNWTYRNVTDFLTENGFSFSEPSDNSVQVWVRLAKNGEPERFIGVPFANVYYTQKALSKIIRQSGIPEERWMEWIADAKA